MFRRLAVLLSVLLSSALFAQTYDQALFSGMKWRGIGPYRGGRVLAVTGVSGDPNTFYFGGVAGGVWKTTDAGAIWRPLSDKEPFTSIGSIAVADSDHNTLYIGTGDGGSCPLARCVTPRNATRSEARRTIRERINTLDRRRAPPLQSDSVAASGIR